MSRNIGCSLSPTILPQRYHNTWALGEKSSHRCFVSRPSSQGRYLAIETEYQAGQHVRYASFHEDLVVERAAYAATISVTVACEEAGVKLLISEVTNLEMMDQQKPQPSSDPASVPS